MLDLDGPLGTSAIQAGEEEALLASVVKSKNTSPVVRWHSPGHRHNLSPKREAFGGR